MCDYELKLSLRVAEYVTDEHSLENETLHTFLG